MTQPGWYPDQSGSGGRRYWDGTNWGPLEQAPAPVEWPQGPPQAAWSPATAAADAPSKKKMGGGTKALIAAGVLVLGGGLVAALSSQSDTSSSTARQASPTTRTVSPEEIERQAAAERARVDPATYRDLSPRDFALLAKDPDAHTGEKVVIYGNVTQFDAATGKDSFRASVGAEPQSRAYDFDQNTFVDAPDPSIITNVVEKDFVTMWVQVAGSYSYDTQNGGNTTVPKFIVNIIKVTGSSG